LATSLALQQPDASFPKLLQVDNTGGVDATLRTVADGEGTDSGLMLSSAGFGPGSGKYLFATVATGITAAGTDQAGATALTTERNNVTTVAANAGVRLPAAVGGEAILVVSGGANALKVYPATGDAIDALAANAAFTQAVGDRTVYYAVSNALWLSMTVGAFLSALAGLSSTGLIARTGTGTVAVRTLTAGAGISITNGNGVSGDPTIEATGGSGSALRNRIVNANGQVSQDDQGTTDNSYVGDVHRLLLEAASAAAYAQETSDLPTGMKTGHRLTVGSGEDNKFGLLLCPVENRDMGGLTGAAVSFACQMKATAGITDVRIGIVQYTGTPDATTADPISSWGSAGTNPTLAADWSYVNTPAALSVTTSWVEYSVLNQTLSGSAVNVAVLIWCDDETTTQTTDILRISDVRLVKGATAPALEPVPYVADKLSVDRLFRLFGGLAAFEAVGAGKANSTTSGPVTLTLAPEMRITPTLAVSAVGDWATNDATGTLTAVTGLSLSVSSTRRSAWFTTTVASGLTAGQALLLFANNTTAARLRLDARL
jgi:hypothetical protein